MPRLHTPRRMRPALRRQGTAARCARALQRPVANVANPNLSRAGRVDGRPQTQKIARDVVVVAGRLHLHVVFLPLPAVGAVVERHDVMVVLHFQMELAADALRSMAIALEPVAMEDEALAVEAEAAVQTAVVEEQ